jgi:cytochrome P450
MAALMTAPPDIDERLRLLLASDPEALVDPFPLYAELREQHPVHRAGPIVLVSRYEDVRALLRDQARFSKGARREGSLADDVRSRLTGADLDAFEEVTAFEALYVSRVDGAEHERLRRIAHRAFTPRRIAELEAATRRYVELLLDEAAARGDVVDLMPFAYQLPLMIICDLLGVPHADRELINHWSGTLGRNRGGTELEPLRAAHVALREFRAYIDEMLAEHRRRPATDLVAALIDAEDGDVLSTDELAAMFVVLLFAGHETTTNLISIGLRELQRVPVEWRRLCADPGLAAAATEELLRWVTPVQSVNRLALEDVEVGGTTVRAGEAVYLMLAAANRDPRAFQSPERLDVTRPDRGKHVSLGYGIHFCLGASLARLEGAAAFGALARRFPGLELAGDEPGFTGNAQLRRLDALPVCLSPRTTRYN